MKRILAYWPVALMMAAALLLTVPMSWAQEDEPEAPNVKLFMRAKLEHSQKALEGLTVEDFASIARSAQAMKLLSQETAWQVLQTPEYAQQSLEFRRAADDLLKAAEDKNLDGSALAYVNITMKCVQCHKYVRSVRNASIPYDGQASVY